MPMISGGPYQNCGQSIDSEKTLFPTIIAAKNTEFRALFTHTPGESGNLIILGPSLALIGVWIVTTSKWWMGPVISGGSYQKLRPIH